MNASANVGLTALATTLVASVTMIAVGQPHLAVLAAMLGGFVCYQIAVIEDEAMEQEIEEIEARLKR